MFELLHLIRGRGVVSVEQVNCISSPSIRQALSSRDTNLGGAGENEDGCSLLINITLTESVIVVTTV